MIAYYRIYYDLQVTDFTGVNYLYIHTPLPSYEITQDDLASFINSNQNSTSFKCKLNENIYAIARIIPYLPEVKLPIENGCLLDVFIFPTPVKNKAPDYIESISIKTIKPMIIKSKVDTIDSIAYPVFEDLLDPIEEQYEGLDTFWKKGKSKTNKLTQLSTSVKPNTVYSKDITSSEINHIAFDSILFVNAMRSNPRYNIFYSFNPKVRSIDKENQDSQSLSEKRDTLSDFTTLDKISMIDLVNIGKNVSYNRWLLENWSVTPNTTSIYELKEFRTGDFQTLPFKYYKNGYSYSDHYIVFNIDNQIFTTTQDHTNEDGALMSEQYDITGFNLFSSVDASIIPYEYLSDETYYSSVNTFNSFELPSAANLSDVSYYNYGYNEVFYNGIKYDVTSWFFGELRTEDQTWVDDNPDKIYSGEYSFNVNTYKSILNSDSFLLPIYTKSYMYGTNVIYTIRQLTKDSIDQLKTNNFNMSYEQFLNNLIDLTNIKYSQRFFVYDLPGLNLQDSDLSNKQEDYGKVLLHTYSIDDQTFISFTGDNFDSQISSQYKLMCNVDISSEGTWDSSYYTIEEQTDFTRIRFALVKCDNTYDYGVSALDISNDTFYMNTKVTRTVGLFDETNNHLLDLTYAFDSANRSCLFGTKVNSIVDRTTLEAIANDYTTDCSYFCALDFVSSFVLSAESPFLYNILYGVGYPNDVTVFSGQTWVTTGNLNMGRAYPAMAGTATSAIIFGGNEADYLSSTEKYESSVQATTAAMNLSREGVAGCGVVDAALAFGGRSSYEGYLSSTEKQNGSIQSTTSGFSENVNYCAGCGNIDDALRFGNGIANGNRTDKQNGSIQSTTSNMTSNLARLSGCGTTTYALSVGGTNPSYTTLTQKQMGSLWVTTSSLNVARYGLAAVGNHISAVSVSGGNGYQVTEKWNGSLWVTTTVIPLGGEGVAACGTSTAAIQAGGYNGGMQTTVYNQIKQYTVIDESVSRIGFPTEFLFGDILTIPSMSYIDNTVYNQTEIFVNKIGISYSNRLTSNRKDSCGVCFVQNDTNYSPITKNGENRQLSFSYKKPLLDTTYNSSQIILNGLYDSSSDGYFVSDKDIFSDNLDVTWGSISEIVSPSIQSIYYAQDDTCILNPYWSTTSGLNSPRSGLGACGSTSSALSMAGSYQSTTEKWGGVSQATTSAMTAAKIYVAAAGNTSGALAFGGQNASYQLLNVNEKWSGTTWATTTVLNESKRYCGGAGTTTDALCGGGAGVISDYNPLSTTELWNGSAQATTNSLNVARCAHGLGGTTSSAIAFSGTNFNVNYDSVEIWNGTSWATTSSMSIGRSELAGCGNTSLAYAIGGQVGGGSAIVEKWSGTAQNTIASLITARSAIAAVNEGNPALSIGTSCEFLSDYITYTFPNLYEYFNNGSQATTGSLTAQRYSMGVCGNTTDALAFGGSSNNGNYRQSTTFKWGGSSWVTTTSLGAAIYYNAGCGTTSAALSIGGYTGAVVTRVEKQSGSAQATTTAISVARYSLIACGTTSDALLFGGSTNAGNYRVANTDKWNGSTQATTTSLNNPIYGHAGCGNTSDALSFGGYTGAVVKLVEKQNGSVWTSASSLNTSRGDTGGCGTVNDALTVGGTTGAIIGSVERFNGTAQLTAPSLNVARYVVGACGTTGSSLSVGGQSGSTTTVSTTEKLTLSVDTIYTTIHGTNDSTSIVLPNQSTTSSLNQSVVQNAGTGTTTRAISFGGSTGASTTKTELQNGYIWSTTSTMNNSRQICAGFGDSYDTIGLGGSHSGITTDQVEKWNGSVQVTTTMNSWRREGLAGCGTTSSGFVFGGAESELWNGSAQSTTSALSVPRAYLAGCGNPSEALSFGGTTGGTTQNSTNKQNGSAQATTTNLIYARHYLAGAGNILDAMSFSGTVATSERQNGSIWKVTKQANIARYGSAGQGSAIAAMDSGGFSGSNRTTSEKQTGDTITTVYPIDNYSCYSARKFGLEEFVGFRTTPNDISTFTGITNNFSPVSFMNLVNYNNNAFSQYRDCMSVLSSMTPNDLCITDDTIIYRNTSIIEPFSRMDNTVIYDVEYLDSTTIIPNKIFLKNKLANKYGIVFDTSSTDSSKSIKSLVTKWKNEYDQMSKSYSFARYASDNSIFVKSGLGIRYFDIDNTSSIIYVDPYSLSINIPYTSPINIGSGNYVHRTPKSCMYYNDGTFYDITQNAIIDMILYNATIGENGSIIPIESAVQSVINIDQTPYQNMAKDTTGTNSITLTIDIDKIYAGDMTIDSIERTPDLNFNYNNESKSVSVNVGMPEVFVTEEASAQDFTMSINNFANFYDFQHSGKLSTSILSNKEYELFEHRDYTTDMTIDFSNKEISMNSKVPTKETRSTGIFVSNQELYSIRNYAYQGYVITDFTSGSPQHYCNITGADYINEDLWSYFNPIYNDYTFENDEEEITDNQSSKYLIDRIFVSSDNVIDSSRFSGIDTITSTVTYTYSNPTKNDMYSAIADLTSDCLLIEFGNITVIIDSTSKTSALCIFKFNDAVVNVYSTTNFDKVFPTTFIGSPYLSVKIISRDGNVMSIINKIKIYSFYPAGNMYIITDYDDELIESTFLDIISNL